MEARLSRLPYTSEALAEARLTLTSFDALIRDHGLTEAIELRQRAWAMLAEDRAARLDARWDAIRSPRDAA